MSSLPYPGNSPNYTSYKTIGGYHRECIVVELACLDKLDSAALALIKERIEAACIACQNTIGIEKIDVVSEDRFDPILRKGLRI